MATAAVFTSVIVIVLGSLPVTSPLRWSPDAAGGNIHTCAGQNVTFAWSFIRDPGDVVTSVKWTFSGQSDEMIAVYVPDDFLPTPAFAHRLQHVPEAGLVLTDVTSGDSGNYSAEVVGHDGAGVSFTLLRRVSMQVSDDQVDLTDHDIHAQLLAKAEYSNSTDQSHAVLTCGNFSFADPPPVTVYWQLPNGGYVASDYYRDGFFHLLLPNPIGDGNYTCGLFPGESLCNQDNEHLASVMVDSVTTRLTLVESRQTTLQAENENLKETVNRLQQRNDVLESLVHKLQNNSRPKPIAFQAMMDTAADPWSGDHVNLQQVMVNVGGAYNSTSGRFTAPVNGTYYFSVLSTPGMKGRTGSLRLVTNMSPVNVTSHNKSLTVCSAFNVDTSPQSAACHAVVSLRLGDQVWLETVGDDFYAPQERSGFNGFLLFADL